MYRAKKSFSILIGVFLITGFFAVNNAVGDGPGWRHGGFGGDPLLELLQKLDLTNAQKKTVSGIISQQLSTLQGYVTNVAEDKAALLKDILTPGTTTATISGEVSKLGSDAAFLANLQAGIWSSINGALGGTQQETNLQNIVAKIGTQNGRFCHHHMFRLLHKLGLSEEQKTAIRSIFSTNKLVLNSASSALASHRATLLKDILTGNTGAIGNATSGDVGAVVTAETALAELQASIWNQIDNTSSPILTPTQLTTLTTIVSKIGTHITTSVDKRFTELGNVMKYWSTL
jgi:hypothetical protein